LRHILEFQGCACQHQVSAVHVTGTNLTFCIGNDIFIINTKIKIVKVRFYLLFYSAVNLLPHHNGLTCRLRSIWGKLWRWKYLNLKESNRWMDTSVNYVLSILTCIAALHPQIPLSFCTKAFSASLTKRMTLQSQSRDCSYYVNRRILIPLQLGLRKHWYTRALISRTLPTFYLRLKQATLWN
jgi:hypothetical protein